MALPALNEITYEIKLPISKKTVTIRPWLMREEKALLVANAVVTILRNCSFDTDVERLPLLDVEYMLLHAKAYSAGEIVPIHIQCKNNVDGKPCNHIGEVDVDILKELVITTPDEKMDNRIQLTDNIGVVMRSPTFAVFKSLLQKQNLPEVSFEMMAASIDHVWMGKDEIIKDFTAQEVAEWLDNFNQKQLSQVAAYVRNLPKLQVKHNYKCKKCGFKGEFILENLFNFFIV